MMSCTLLLVILHIPASLSLSFTRTHMTYALLQHITKPLSMLLSQSPTFIVSTPHSHVHLTPNLRYLFQVNPNLPRHSRYSSLFTSPIWTLHQRRPGCVLPVIIHDLLTILCPHFSMPPGYSLFTFAMLHDHLTPVRTAPPSLS